MKWNTRVCLPYPYTVGKVTECNFTTARKNFNVCLHYMYLRIIAWGSFQPVHDVPL